VSAISIDYTSAARNCMRGPSQPKEGQCHARGSNRGSQKDHLWFFPGSQPMMPEREEGGLDEYVAHEQDGFPPLSKIM